MSDVKELIEWCKEGVSCGEYNEDDTEAFGEIAKLLIAAEQMAEIFDYLVGDNIRYPGKKVTAPDWVYRAEQALTAWNGTKTN